MSTVVHAITARPAAVFVPRGSTWAAGAFAAVVRFFERVGQRRAEAEMERVCAFLEATQPSFAAEMNALRARNGR